MLLIAIPVTTDMQSVTTDHSVVTSGMDAHINHTTTTGAVPTMEGMTNSTGKYTYS